MTYSTADVQALMNEVDHNNAQIAALQARNKTIRESLAYTALGAVWNDAHGTQHITVAGIKLTFEFAQNYTVKRAELDKIYPGLSEQDKRAIKFKPEISLTGLKEMSAEGRARLNAAITTRPALPTVKYGK